MDDLDLDLECGNCAGHGVYTSGRVCELCDGTGKRRCNVCCRQPAEDGIEPDHTGVTYVCAACRAQLLPPDNVCAYCREGAPVAEHAQLACCEKCLATFADWSIEETGT